MARRIIEWRDANGRFTSVEDLLAVPGIGDKMLESLRDARDTVTTHSAMKARARDTRLVPIALATWATSLTAIFAPQAAGWLAAALWAAALGGLAWAAHGDRTRAGRGALTVLVLSLALSAAVASHVAMAQPAREAALGVSLAGGRAVDVRAVVTTKAEHGPNGRLRFDADASSIGVGSERIPVAVPVSISVAAHDVTDGVLDLGSEIIARGTAMAADAGDRAVLVVFASRGVEVRARTARRPRAHLRAPQRLRRGAHRSSRSRARACSRGSRSATRALCSRRWTPP